MENNGVVQFRRNPNRKPLSDISNTAFPNTILRPNPKPKSSSNLNAGPTSLREFGSCSNAAPSCMKSKSNPKSNRNQNAEPNRSNNNFSNSIASSSDTNHASCSTPAPNNPQSVLNLGEKSSEIKQLTTYRSRKSRTNQLETNTERETGTSETQVLTKRRKTGTNETEIVNKSRETGTSGLQIENSKKRKTGTSGLEINTTKKGKTGTNEPHLAGASSCPPIQKNMPKKGEKSAKRKRRLVVSSAPAKKRQKAVEWPKDFVEKQREYFAEVDAEELLEDTDSD